MPKIKMPSRVIVKGGFTRSCPRWTCVATTETSLKGLFWLFIVGCHGEGLCKVVRGQRMNGGRLWPLLNRLFALWESLIDKAPPERARL